MSWRATSKKVARQNVMFPWNMKIKLRLGWESWTRTLKANNLRTSDWQTRMLLFNTVKVATMCMLAHCWVCKNVHWGTWWGEELENTDQNYGWRNQKIQNYGGQEVNSTLFWYVKENHWGCIFYINERNSPIFTFKFHIALCICRFCTP